MAEARSTHVPRLTSVFSDSQLRQLKAEYDKLNDHFEVFMGCFSRTSERQLREALQAIARQLVLAGHLNDELGLMDRLFATPNYKRYHKNLQVVRAEVQSVTRDLAHNTRAFLQREDDDIRMELEAAGGEISESTEQRIRRHKHLTEMVHGVRALMTGTKVFENFPELGTTSAPASELDDISEVVSLHRVDTADFR